MNANLLMLNMTLANDVTPPRIAKLEQAPDRTASATPTVVRFHVYDNAPMYVTGMQNETELEVSVGTVPLPVLDHEVLEARWSGGQVFRVAVPGQLVGTVEYFARSVDGYGNVGVSPPRTYLATGGTNSALHGSGTPGAGGLIPDLFLSSAASGGNPVFAFLIKDGLPAGSGLLALALAPLIPPLNVGVEINLDPATLFLVADLTLDSLGHGGLPLPVPPGLSGAVEAQYFGLDPAASLGISSSPGLTITVTP